MQHIFFTKNAIKIRFRFLKIICANAIFKYSTNILQVRLSKRLRCNKLNWHKVCSQ